MKSYVERINVDRSECYFCIIPENAISGGKTDGLVTSEKFGILGSYSVWLVWGETKWSSD